MGMLYPGGPSVRATHLVSGFSRAILTLDDDARSRCTTFRGAQAAERGRKRYLGALYVAVIAVRSRTTSITGFS